MCLCLAYPPGYLGVYWLYIHLPFGNSFKGWCAVVAIVFACLAICSWMAIVLRHLRLCDVESGECEKEGGEEEEDEEGEDEDEDEKGEDEEEEGLLEQDM